MSGSKIAQVVDLRPRPVEMGREKRTKGALYRNP